MYWWKNGVWGFGVGKVSDRASGEWRGFRWGFPCNSLPNGSCSLLRDEYKHAFLEIFHGKRRVVHGLYTILEMRGEKREVGRKVKG